VRPITHLESTDSEFEFPSESPTAAEPSPKVRVAKISTLRTQKNSLAFNLSATFHRYTFLFRRIFP
jgi:hypothetical protein